MIVIVIFIAPISLKGMLKYYKDYNIIAIELYILSFLNAFVCETHPSTVLSS